MSWDCKHCGKKLLVVGVKGEATIICRSCWKTTRIVVSAKVAAQ